MRGPTLEERMENIEQIVEPLRALPVRLTKVEARLTTVESQIVQLRVEMHDEFSSIRRDMATRDELARSVAGLATRSEMLMLHEDLVERLKVLGESLSRPARERRKTQ
jgi:hypothetical protein